MHPNLPAVIHSPALFAVRFQLKHVRVTCRSWSLPSTGMDDYAAKVWRTPVPPTPCVVDSSKVFPDLAQSARWRNETPLWLRSHGLVIGPELPGVVLRWARLATGGWIAEVRVEASTGHGEVPLTLWVAQDAVRAA